MADEIICLDTSILIDFFRTQLKEKSTFFKLTKMYHLFAVSIITAKAYSVGMRYLDRYESAFDMTVYGRLRPFNVISPVAFLLKEKSVSYRTNIQLQRPYLKFYPGFG